MLCHGNGDLSVDGCCYVNGAVCPLRWKLVAGRILEGPDLTDRGTVVSFAASVSNNPNIRQRIIDQAQGLTYACSAAINALVADAKLLNDRPGFEAAWAARPEYQPIADAWEAIGKPRDWCPKFGPAEGQCCFGETQAVNDAKVAALSTTAVNIRSKVTG